MTNPSANPIEQINQRGLEALERNELAQAIECFSEVRRLDPGRADCCTNLGEAHRRLGQFEQALAFTEEAVLLNRRLAEPHANLGLIHQHYGRHELAADCFAEAVRLRPDAALLHALWGQSLWQIKRADQAEFQLRRSIDLNPSDPRAHFQLAILLAEQQRLDEAQAAYQEVLTLNPRHAETLNNLGSIHHRRRDLSAAERCFREAISIHPDFLSAHSNLGAVLAELGDYEQALEHLNLTIAKQPRLASALCNIGYCMERLGRLDEAIGVLNQALAVNPQSAAALTNLGNAYRQLGQASSAVTHYRRALELDSANPTAHSNLLYTLNLLPESEPAELFEEHRAWGARHADPLTARAEPHANDRTPARRLRVGYVSDHFRLHAVAFFSEPILASHDRQAFEVFCYSTAPQTLNDETTARFRSYADQWRDVGSLPDAQLAEAIRKDKIDILVDLAGHIAGNRLMAFARKPAPIAVTYLGYQNTTGMKALDYRVTDEWSDPQGTEAFHTERLLRLPRTFFCYRPLDDAPPVGPLPLEAQGYVTFGSFNNFAKVGPRLLAHWAQILSRVPNSRLLVLAASNRSLQKQVTSAFQAEGVSASRLIFHGNKSNREFLELIGQVDVALDTFPFNGHTTTCDCLWMGVPVVSLAGTTYASRFGSSALVNLGLQELVAATGKEYVEMATRLAGDARRLSELRGSLRAQMAGSPICDARTFTRNLETAYRQMWARWCEKRERTVPTEQPTS